MTINGAARFELCFHTKLYYRRMSARIYKQMSESDIKLLSNLTTVVKP